MTPNRLPADVSFASRTLHFLTAWSSKATASAIATVASVSIIVLALASQHPDTILVWFAAIAAAITLVMVFVLQHTQTRQQEALQHKLDEVLLALPGADNRLIKLESAPDSEIVEVELRHIARRNDAHDF